MKSVRGYAVVCMLLGVLAADAAAQDFSRSLVFLEAQGAPGAMPRERLRTGLGLLVRELKLEGKSLPVIMVVHATRAAAQAAGVSKTTVRRNRGADDAEALYYELWIVGEPKLTDCTIALHNILENHFELHLSAAERNSILARVYRTLQSTVNVAHQGQ